MNQRLQHVFSFWNKIPSSSYIYGLSKVVLPDYLWRIAWEKRKYFSLASLSAKHLFSEVFLTIVVGIQLINLHKFAYTMKAAIWELILYYKYIAYSYRHVVLNGRNLHCGLRRSRIILWTVRLNGRQICYFQIFLKSRW